VNRRCSGYRIQCPALVGRPWGPDNAYDADDQPCETMVHVTLDGDRGTADVWIEEYEPECSHEYDELAPGEQEEALRRAIEVSLETAMDRLGRDE
jgi:hypothetical protein